jgi:hypothetical protein
MNCVIAVIVEEAAEVPESHIVASLTRDCEHLILIGMFYHCIYIYTHIMNLSYTSECSLYHNLVFQIFFLLKIS